MRESNYARFHQDRTNLIVHVVTVPLFAGGLLGVIWALGSGDWLRAAVLATLPAIAMAAQGWGHGREPVPPEPFDGPADFAKRILLEQFYRFPSFVVSGGLDAAWRAGAAPPQRRR